MSKLISMTAAMTCLAITASAGNDTPHWSLTWKKMQTTGPELELIGTLPTRTTHELGASDWSVGCETLDRAATPAGRSTSAPSRSRTGTTPISTATNLI